MSTYGAAVGADIARYLVGQEDWAKLVSKLGQAFTKKLTDMVYAEVMNAYQQIPVSSAQIGNFVGNYGLSVMLVGLLIRLVLLPFTIKTMKQSENMKKVQPEMAKIERKYAGRDDQQSQIAKSQEMMMLYKKYNVSPFGSCLMSFIQLPLFFGFLEAINRIPAIFEGSLGVYQLGTTPLIGLKSGNYYYVVLILLIMLTTFLSFKFSMSNGTGNAEQEKQMKMMTGFMLIFISIASFSLPTAIALYWVVTNGFSVVSNLLIKKGSK